MHFRFRYIRVVEHLLSHGATPDLSPHDGCSPLYMASRQGHADAVDRLLQAGADPNKANRRGETPLAMAEARGHWRIAVMLKAVEKRNAARK